MMKVVIIAISIILLCSLCFSQNRIKETQDKKLMEENFTFQIKSKERQLIINSVREFFIDIKSDKTNSQLINPTDFSTNLFFINQIKNFIKDNDANLINAYSISPSEYILKFAVFENEEKTQRLRAIFSIMAINEKGKIKFSSLIKYRTKTWKNKKIGNVNYFYQDSLNRKIAEKFNRKNRKIAKKFGVPKKNLTYYKCLNYAEVLRILGIDFDSKSAGTVQSSEAFEDTIITGVNSEDFSHDLFHMYIETKFPDSKNRNFIAEEGYANSIANAYYAKKNGEIITRRELVFYLKEYLEKNPKANLLELFQKNPRVYFQLSDQVSHEVFKQLSVKSTITSLICDEAEKIKGFEGLIKLLRSGKGEDAFFDTAEQLIGINKLNFDKKVRELISNFM